jgi:hypothetical protein
MKLGISVLAADVAGQEVQGPFEPQEVEPAGDITPFLDALETYCKEAVSMPAYDTRKLTQEEFAAKWMNRCTKHRYKLDDIYHKVNQKGESCGTFDESYVVDFTTNPPARNPCQALADVTSEFNRFTTTFLTSDQVCGTRRRSKLVTRMNIIKNRLIAKTDCDSYLFEDTKIDNLCNAVFMDANGVDCPTYLSNGWCPLDSNQAQFYIDAGVEGDHGIETGLNCPQCGCNMTPPSLYDVNYVEPPSLEECVEAIANECYMFAEGENDYRVCVNGEILQRNRVNTNTFSLGRWDENPLQNDYLSYTGGTYCDPIGAARRAQVHFTLGQETEAVSVTEPSTCFYRFEMTCNPNPAPRSGKKARRTEFLPFIQNSTVV